MAIAAQIPSDTVTGYHKSHSRGDTDGAEHDAAAHIDGDGIPRPLCGKQTGGKGGGRGEHVVETAFGQRIAHDRRRAHPRRRRFQGKPPLSKSAAEARYIYPYFFCFRNRNIAEMRVAKTSAAVMAYQMPSTSNKSGRSITDAD